MKKEFIGDALDHYKGSILKLLSSDDLLENLAIEPMITDDNAWTPDEISLYLRLLCAPENTQIIHKGKPFLGNRKKYFAEINQTGDVFLDPDTGVTTSKVSPGHIKATELNIILNEDRMNKSVLIVYQHNAIGRKFEERIKEIVEHVLAVIEKGCCTTYEGRQVGMIFLSKNEDRIKLIHQRFKEFLGEKYAFRTRIWGNNP
jgi:hypothetical protein